MEILFGLETEYGITRERPGTNLDVVAESISLVRSAKAPGVRMRWDYSYEDPHVDARGFRVGSLRQDTDESQYFAADAARELSFSEIKSDLAIKNGARFYNDHAHPEYCTPECSTLLEILQQDYVGDQIVMDCARDLNQKTDNPVLIYKNNTDFQGHSYGCHENYLLPRQLPWAQLAQGIQAFLVTRQIIAGTGKYGWEAEDRFLRAGFQVSQRADFFSTLQSVDTMQRRPIVNTRDEPHADEARYRRFHVIVGDANLSPYANWLKIGTTALALEAMVGGAKDEEIPHLKDPIQAIKDISRDPSWKWEVILRDGSKASAIDIQRRYAELAQKYAKGLDEEWTRVLQAWHEVLDDLAEDPLRTSGKLDWTAKYELIDGFRKGEGLAEDDPWLRSLDLSYHHLDEEEGLFFGLQQQGAFESPYPFEAIHTKELEAPSTTRAAIRGICIERFGGKIDAAQWDMVRFTLPEGGYLELNMRHLFDQEQIRFALKTIRNATSVTELASLPLAKQIT